MITCNHSVLLQYVAKQKTVEEGVQDMWEVRLTLVTHTVAFFRLAKLLLCDVSFLLQSLSDTKLRICDMVEAENDG